MDWNAAKTEYITTNTSYRKLAEKYGVQKDTIANRAKQEKWIEARRQYQDRLSTKLINLAENKELSRAEKISNAADLLLEKIIKAISEVDLTLETNTVKVKEIEYKNKQRPDKPTKETITETVDIKMIQTIVDRAGLKSIASALRDLKEVQNIKSDADIEEQEARIANLRSKAKDDAEGSSAVIEIKGDAEGWSE